MRKIYFLTLTSVAFFVWLGQIASGQSSNTIGLVPKNNLVGAPSICTQTPVNVQVPLQLFDGAKLKARLATLLRESLDDDAHGILDVAREKEIKKLADKLRNLKN